VKVNYSNTLTSICQHLGLLDGTPSVDVSLLEKAAKWALNTQNTEGSLLGKYQPVALRPVLATLKGNTTTTLFCAAEKLSTGLHMPKEKVPNMGECFYNLKKALKEATKDTLLSTLEAWGSTLAFSDRYKDLSLFDFIRTTVGIALCLEANDGKMRLIGGGISGIQPYLYEIISKNAAKLLKGRSFYIQLLVDSFLDEVLTEFNVSDCHVVYASGGGFYVLVPDTEGSSEKFKTFATRMSEAIHKAHKMTLAVDLAITEPFDKTQPINEIWKGLFDDLEKLKYKRLNNSSILLDAFFNKVEQGGTREKDPITNEEFGLKDNGELDKVTLHQADDKNDPNTIWVSPATKAQINLGKNLTKAEYWVISKDEFSTKLNSLKDPFSKFHYLIEEKDLPTDLTDKKVFFLNPEEVKHPTTGDKYPTVFYGGNKFPFHEKDSEKKDKNNKPLFKEGDIKAFDELIDNEDFKRLGILQMDVDGLGSIFSVAKNIESTVYGLNWVRYVAVSRSLDHFFKGYINCLKWQVETAVLWQTDRTSKDTSVIIYSGGDDLFIVGRWDTVVAFAEAIHQDFKAWTNGVLTISGGLELLPAKFPIMQGARLTADAEKKAKKHKNPFYTEGSSLGEKNALTFLGTPLTWEHEFELVNKLQEKLYDYIEPEEILSDDDPPQSLGKPKALDRSIIGKINSHAEAQRLYNETKAKGEPSSPKWMWLIAYDLTQLRDRLPKEAKEMRDFIDELKNACVSNQYKGERIKSAYPFLQLLQLAARWAEMRYRSNV
jgi:CRISPR-associated protein Csm1